MYAPVNVIPEDQYEIWKNSVPVDTTKKDSATVTPVTSADTTAGIKSDSLNSGAIKDSLKNETPASDIKKTDTLK